MSTQTSDRTTDETALRALFTQFLDGWNAGSGEEFATPFTDACDFIAFDGTHLTSRAQIVRVRQELLDRWLKGTLLTGSATVRFLDDNTALLVARGDTVMRGKSEPAPERASIQT